MPLVLEELPPDKSASSGDLAISQKGSLKTQIQAIIFYHLAFSWKFSCFAPQENTQTIRILRGF